MSFPTYYDPAKAETLYEADLEAAYAAGSAAFRTSATTDDPRILLLLVDVQVDFVYPAPIGRLAVPNALADTRRTVEWIYQHAQRITQIAASLDTHVPHQIFFSSWWVDRTGQHPPPFTVITSADVAAGNWRPTTEPAWSAHYVEQLERSARKQLMIWPYHCLEGTNGRALAPALAEAILYHSGARMAQPTYWVKGTLAQTEFYSIFEPEVKAETQFGSAVNTAALEFLDTFDLIYVAGQARSHCVLETMRSILRHYSDLPDVLAKFRYLKDASSSITGFEAATEAEVSRYASQGIRLVTTADPLG